MYGWFAVRDFSRYSSLNVSVTCVPSRYTLYPPIPPRSKEGFHLTVTTPGAVMVAVNLSGTEGGKVSDDTWERFETEEMSVKSLCDEGEG